MRNIHDAPDPQIVTSAKFTGETPVFSDQGKGRDGTPSRPPSPPLNPQLPHRPVPSSRKTFVAPRWAGIFCLRD